MEKRDDNNGRHRRRFLGQLTAGTAALGIAGLLNPLQSFSAPSLVEPASTLAEPDEWFNKIKGKHRIIFDVTKPNDLMPFAWPRVFLLTNQATGTMANDCNVVVVLRHEGIPYAFQSDLWAKYNFGEVFKADDPATKKPSTRNPFWQPGKDDFQIPGFGTVQIGINELQDSGVMFCVCNAAITVYSAVLAGKMQKDAAEVKKEWMAALLPGIQVMPSGVWAVGRAQEHGCTYCYAG